MKSNIHPQWHPEAQVSCVCGNVFSVGSTKSEIRVEICSRCHPFFTGEMKYTTGKGKIERFQEKRQHATSYKSKQSKKKQTESAAQQPKTLKEMLLDLQ